jgi:uncharacterized integral membrane protein
MQALFILSILFGLAAILFALQNPAPVTVAFGPWSVDSSLAVVLILSLALGALIASLLTTPGVIRSQALATRLRRKVEELEQDRAALRQRISELDHGVPPAEPEAVIEPQRSPYVGLRSALLSRKALH